MFRAEPSLSRRRFLGSAAALGGAAWAAGVLPPNVAKALASPPPRNGRIQDIEHVVILMQENRSFDHYFGTRAGCAVLTTQRPYS